jgi:hypothetical protein
VDGMTGNYYYEIEFLDGRIVRRAGVPKSKAKAVYEAMEYEMILFNIKSVSWGLNDR